MTTLRVLGLHGVGDHHSDPSWKGQWTAAIEAALRRWDPSLSVACDLPVYDALFDDPRYELGAGRYAEAVGKMTASGVSVGLEKIGDKIGDAVDAIGNEIGSWFRPASRDLSSLPNELRWTAGMVAQWADFDALREASRAWLAQQLAAGPYDVVVAHSLGSLIAYDTFVHGQTLLTGATTLALFGSQVGNPFVRDSFGGYLMPLKGPREWYQLYNPDDRAFSAPIRLPGDPKFRRTVTRFSEGFMSHDALKYLSHPDAIAGFWREVAATAKPARGLASIGRSLAAFDARLSPATRDRKVTRGRAEPNKRALLIGINDYPDPANRLEGCLNDVFLISAALQESGFGPEDIRVVFDDRATTQGILERMGWLLDGTRAGDERVLFYSGHGAQIPGYGTSLEIDHLKECLVPHDFDWSEQHAITDTQLAELYSQLPYDSRFVAIFDCCHSGGLSRDGGARVRGITPPDDVRHRMLCWNREKEMWEPRKLPDITKDKGLRAGSKRQAFVGTSGANFRLGRGMAIRSLERAKTRARQKAVGSVGPYLPMILEACSEQELSYEYRHGVTSYGAFTFSLTKELRDARRSTTSRARAGIDFLELMKRTTKRLQDLDYDQTPCLVGPTAQKRVPIPWTTPKAR